MKPHLPNKLYATLLAAVSAVCFTLPQSWAAPVVITLGEINTNAAHNFVTDDFVLNAVGDTTYDLSDGSTLAMTLSGGKFWGTHNNGDGVLTGTWTNTAALAEWNNIINGGFTAADLSAGDNYCYTASGNGGSTSTATLSLDSSLYTAGSSIITIYVTATAKSGSLNDFTVSGLDDCVLSYATNNGNGFVDTPAYSNGASAITLIKATGTLNGSDIAMHSSTGKNGWQSISYTIGTPIPPPIPPDYTAVYITQTEQLSSYTKVDYKAFVIGSNINNNSYKIEGEHQYWADATINTHVLTFSGLPNGALEANTELAVKNFKEVNFINSTIVSAGVLSLTGNESITFCDNSNYYTSAIYANGSIHLANNKRVAFTNNNAGAICAFGDVSIENNEKVEFSRNHPDTSNFDGYGALYGVSINISNNDSVLFRENDSASWKAGAIVTASMSLTGNGHVEFRGNSVAYSTGMRFLRCIDLRSSEQLNLAAGEGQDITFYDSIYAQTLRYMGEYEDLKVSYNADYTDRDGEIRKATGDIVFSGKYAKQDLAELKADYTPEELAASLTTEVLYATTNLYGGRLRIEDGAIYKGDGINVAADSHATLRLANGTLDQAGYDVVLGSGATLELQGTNSVTANSLDMQDGSTMSFALDQSMLTTPCLSVTGVLNIHTGIQMELSGYEKAGEYYLASFSSFIGDLDDIELPDIFPEGSRQQAILSKTDKHLILTVTGCVGTLRWAGGSGTWCNGVGTKWTSTDVSDTKFHADYAVVFDKKGTVTISGEVAPWSVNVLGASAIEFKGTGSIVGETSVVKDDSGTLTMNATNAYTGGTIINDGTVNASGADSFGVNSIQLNGGTLNMKTHAVENEIIANGGSISGTSYKGNLSVRGDVVVNDVLSAGGIELESGSITGGTITDTMIYAISGVINSDVTGEGELYIDGDVTFSGTANHTLGTYVNAGIFTLTGSMSSDIVLMGGTLKTDNLQLGEGQLLELSGGSVQGNVSAGKNSLLDLYADSAIDGDLALDGALVELNGSSLEVTGRLTVENGSFDAHGGIHAHEVQLGSDAIMEVRNASGETMYSVKSAPGKSALAQGVAFTAESVTGIGDKAARIDHSVIKLEEGASVVFDNVILGASSQLKDDPATVVANNLVIEGILGENVQEGEPMTIKSGSVLHLTGNPGQTVVIEEDSFACTFDITNVQDVQLSGNCLTIDLSSMYPKFKDMGESFDWLGIALGSGDHAPTIDENLEVVVQTLPNQRAHGYVGWGGTFVTVPDHGENVGPVIYFHMYEVPEPATSTLSLLALAALAARRRRSR